MTILSLYFFVFLLISLLLYYCIRPAQKYILLLASLYFYVRISPNSVPELIALVAIYSIVTYGGGLLLEKLSGGWKKAVLVLCSLLLFGTLCVLKYAYNLAAAVSALFSFSADFSFLKFGAFIGIAYFTFTAAGYLIDVYWGNCPAEKNPFDVVLFIFYFPQLISGPLTRYPEMHPRLSAKRKPDYEYISLGIRRMAWGYFKKLVISERFAVVVNTVFKNYPEYSFTGILIAACCYAVQLYTDFSGCMDIIIGASNLFGVDLPENFNAPFLSETVQEFWQRWHITLGTWFKTYLMYPLQKSGFIQFFGRIAKARFGKKAGKKIPFYLSMIVLWGLIGLWHGGNGYYFVAVGAVPCFLLIFSDLLQPVSKSLVKTLRINTQCASWKWVRRIRTFLLLCISWFIVCAGNLRTAGAMLGHALTRLWDYTPFAAAIEKVGLNPLDILIMTLGVVILYIADKCQYDGSTLFRRMNEQNLWVRILLICLEILAILVYGAVGKSSFIYFEL